MGLDIKSYLLIGVKLDYEAYAEKMLENYDTNVTDYLTQVSDPYNASYFYLGHVLAEAHDDYGETIDETYEGFGELMRKYDDHFKKVAEEIKPFLNEDDKPRVDMFHFKHFY